MGTEIILCDTDVMIEYLHNNEAVLKIMSEYGLQNLFITPITKAELQSGCFNKVALRKLNKTLDIFMMADIDAGVSNKFSQMFETYFLSHQPSIPDCLNAAFALFYNVPIFTLNKKDFHFYNEIKLLPHNIKPVKKSLTP